MIKKYSLLALLYFAVALSISFVLQKNQSQQKVEKYLYLWEDEIAKNIISEPNHKFIERISDHLELLDASVANGTSGLMNKKKVEQVHQCSFNQVLPISLYGLPAGELAVCYDLKSLTRATLLSPLFISLVFMGFLSALIASITTIIDNERLKGQLLVSQEISRLARQVAHDIRSPLSVLKTFAELKEWSPEKSKLLQEATSRIHNVAEDLLQKGRQELVTKTITHDKNEGAPPMAQKSTETSKRSEITQCIQSTVDQFRFRHPEVMFFISPFEQELWIPLDEAKFNRILTNILNNSVEAKSPNRDLKIKITTSSESDKILLIVEDNGVGISPSNLGKISLEGYSQGKTNGTGLGLFDATISIEAVGGTLRVESKEGDWTKIKMQWPVAALTQNSATT